MTVEERIQKQREQKLISLGYCTQVFDPKEAEDGYTNLNYDESAEGHEYPEVDVATGQHFRYVADDVTDEQFQRIIAIGGPHTTESANTLASVLTLLAWIICVILVVIGLTTATGSGYRGGFNFTVFGVWAGAGVGTLLSLLWFAEVLRLLQSINDKL